MAKGQQILLVVIKLIIVIAIQMIGIAVLLIPDLFKSITLDYEVNDFCQTYQQNNPENNLDYLVCDNKFKKKKIILLLIDSLPFDVLYDFQKLKEIKMTNLFRGEGLEYKQSGALFETILTGKFSRNYLATIPMKMDNIQKQFYYANLTIFSRIRHFPFYTLFNRSYIDVIEKHDGEFLPMLSFCPIDISYYSFFRDEIMENYADESGMFLKEGITQEILYEKANEKLKKEFSKIRQNFNKCFRDRNFKSIIFYTDTLDHIIHTSHRRSPRAIFSIYFLEQYVKELINWINEEHGEYALALASDHGGQLYFGEDTLCNHGCNGKGNEAVFFVYTKELGENYEKYKTKFENEESPIVSMNDIACTFIQSVKNANLPLESTCKPRYIGNDSLLMFVSVKSKEIQLKQYLQKLVKKYPELKNQYERKYNKKLNDNKFVSFFKNEDSIYEADKKLYDEYMNYLIKIQDELFSDVIKSGHNTKYYLILYLTLAFFIIGFLYFIRKLILLTREKVFKEMKKEGENRNPFLSKIVTYTYIIVGILLIEPLMSLIYNNSINISYYIRISIFIKFFLVLFLVIIVTFLNNVKKDSYKRLIFNFVFILILNLVATKIELFSSLDKYISTQPRSDFSKIYFSYPLFIVYLFLEFYSDRNYYLSKKYKIRYIYILIPYIIILSYLMFNFDIDVTIKNDTGNSPEKIKLLKKIYIMTFLLLLFIKPFFQKEIYNSNKFVSSDIINLKIFLFIMISFIGVELERILIILFFNIIMLYLCHYFKKEKDIFIKIIYAFLIVCYPQIQFIANQGTYTMDTGIKVTIKCPSRWADDRPILMGFIFVLDKYRYDIMAVGYIFFVIKITNKNIMNYYTKLAILLQTIQLFGILIVFLYFVKVEREGNYVQILYLIATHVTPIVIFDIAFLVNYIIYTVIKKLSKDDSPIEEYEEIKQLNIDIDSEDNKII